MEASAALGLHSGSWIGIERAGRRPRPGGLLTWPTGRPEERRVRKARLRDLGRNGGGLSPKISCCYKKNRVPENFHSNADEAHIIKSKAQDVAPYLSGRCIYLVGMMGSGKTTVGKIISEVLGYAFFDSDKLVEQSVGISSVAQIFKDHSEAFFRDNESKVLRDLSSMCRLVVATGGGAVIRPMNWRYMKQGITIWLDVPLEALARRIAAVGTDSRPLLHQESGDPYTKAFARLTMLSEQRGEAYANADARVSLEHIATKQGHGDVISLTPTDIALEALIKIESFLTKKATQKAVVGRSFYLQG